MGLKASIQVEPEDDTRPRFKLLEDGIKSSFASQVQVEHKINVQAAGRWDWSFEFVEVEDLVLEVDTQTPKKKG
jgi:hypothetical protein